jgi:hypothetical protein
MAMHELSHCATVACAVDAEVAYAYLADPANLGSWALGCLNATPVSEDSVAGTSLFDGAESVVRVDGDPDHLTVNFVVSGGGETGAPISARVVPGLELGWSPERCLVTLLAWRPAGMTDARWAQLIASHEVEILLLQRRIEALA